jgi:hypothetical protein
MLEGTTRIWIDSLPENLVNCWNNIKEAFTHNFEGTYKRPYTMADLARCRQKMDESSRDFLARWITINNSCEGVHEVQVVNYFTEGLVRGTALRHYLKRVNPTTLAELISIASQFAAADDDARGAPLLKKQASSKRKANDEDNLATDMVATTYTGLPIMVPASGRPSGRGGGCGGGRGGGKGRQGDFSSTDVCYKDLHDAPCYFHSTTEQPANHVTRVCRVVNKIKTDPEAGY